MPTGPSARWVWTTPEHVSRAWPLWTSTASNSPCTPTTATALAELCAEGIPPIALDESLIGVHALTDRMRLLDHVKPQHVVLKPSLIGGLDSATVWSRLAEQRGMSWWVTSALESNVGLQAIAQWVAVQPALNQPSPVPQGLGTGGLFVNNIPGNLSVVLARFSRHFQRRSGMKQHGVSHFVMPSATTRAAVAAPITAPHEEPQRHGAPQ